MYTLITPVLLYIITGNKYITETTYIEAKIMTQQKLHVATLSNPWVIKQHHWNTGAKENHVEHRWAEKQT